MIAPKRIMALLACFFMITAGHAVQQRRVPGTGIPESVFPTDRDNPALWTSAFSYSKTNRAALPGYYAVSDIPRTGTQEYLLVLVDFTNKPFIITDSDELVEQYDRIFNEQGYYDDSVYTYKDFSFHGATGSVNDYFRAQSYNQYNPVFKVVGPIHMSHDYAYYGKNNGQSDADGVNKMVFEVCDSLAARTDVVFSGYARDGNIDQLSIIYAGKGENYDGADKNTIWPQANYISYNRNGVQKVKFACTCELFWDSDSILDGIGTFCHEFSHTLGLPDFYNVYSASESETNASMGYWSIMDYGNYENQGFSPVGYTAFEKYSLGWMEIEEITYPGTYLLNDISCKPDPDEGIHSAYRLNTGNEDQFIILENHIKTGWYQFHASQGLMVTAVNYYNNSWVSNTVNTNSRKRYYILPADNNYNRNTNQGDLFPYQDIDSITTLGAPQLSAGSSYPPYSIYGITQDTGKVSFYASMDMPTKVEALANNDISMKITDGELLVQAPVGSRLSIHDVSGRTILETVITEPHQSISLPGEGIIIVRCENLVRKLRID